MNAQLYKALSTICRFHARNELQIRTRLEFLVDVVAIETALGVDVDQGEIQSYFDTIDSNGDGNLQVWEFYAIPNAKIDRFVCGGLCIGGAVVFGSAIGGWFSGRG